MPNITMTINEDLLKKTRKLAVEKNTTLTALIRAFLENLAQRQHLKKEEIIIKLKTSFNNKKVKVGEKTWNRPDLHER